MDHPRRTEFTDKQTYQPGYAGTTNRKSTELASVISGGGGCGYGKMGGSRNLWFFLGGGAFMHLAEGGGVQPASFWSIVEKFWEVVARSGEIGMWR